MGEIQLKVDTTIMKAKAGEINQLVADIKNDYEGLKVAANATKGYWTGDAANTFRTYVKNIENDMQTVLKRLNEHPKDLLEMAGIYLQNENDVVEFTKSLPTNVIQ